MKIFTTEARTCLPVRRDAKERAKAIPSAARKSLYMNCSSAKPSRLCASAVRILHTSLLTVFVLALFTPISFSQSSESKLTPGIIMDTVKCKKAPHQSYALYLPKSYSAAKSWPVIFFYDPGARGKVPVTSYSSLAETYKCILICSNNSRNGPVALALEAEEAIMQDVTARFSVAPDKFFISGFSGGARAAVHLSLQNKVYAGIIACGAAFVPNDQLTQTDSKPFIEIVGNEDMNFSEALETKHYLETIHYPHSLLVFEGIHAWPPAEVFAQAIFWQFMQFQKKSKLNLDDSIIRDYQKHLTSLIRQEIDSGDVYLANLNLTQAVDRYAGHSPTLDSLRQRLQSNSLLAKQQNEFPKMLKKEEEVRQEIGSKFSFLQGAIADSAFKEPEWRSIVERQNRLIKSKSRQDVLMARRLLGWMRIVCYEQYRSQFQASDYLHATMTARVYTMLENDYSPYLMLARAYAARTMKPQALTALKKAVDLGLKQRKTIENDKFFAVLQNEKGYQEVLKIMDAK